MKRIDIEIDLSKTLRMVDRPSQWLTEMTRKISLLPCLFIEIYKLLFSVRPLRRSIDHSQDLGWWELNSQKKPLEIQGLLYY
ncbi:MAG: hypothetical protein RAO94_11190 [Candidatus Stygibacter australis]|nr:hypothetical protein [Candidatus Stygibacter australis]